MIQYPILVGVCVLCFWSRKCTLVRDSPEFPRSLSRGLLYAAQYSLQVPRETFDRSATTSLLSISLQKVWLKVLLSLYSHAWLSKKVHGLGFFRSDMDLCFYTSVFLNFPSPRRIFRLPFKVEFAILFISISANRFPIIKPLLYM